jgi:hypothetical protein
LLTSTNGNVPLPIVDVPMIQMPTQTEVVTWAEMGIAYRRPDSDAPGNRFRLYEVAGMPHNSARESPAFAGDPCTLPVTDFPAGAFTALGLNHLIEWIAKGGERNVWEDVPIATYGVFGKGKTTATDRLCLLAGTEVPLASDRLKRLYPDASSYRARLTQRLEALVKAGWFLPEYVDAVQKDVAATTLP